MGPESTIVLELLRTLGAPGVVAWFLFSQNKKLEEQLREKSKGYAEIIAEKDKQLAKLQSDRLEDMKGHLGESRKAQKEFLETIQTVKHLTKRSLTPQSLPSYKSESETKES